MSWSDSEVGEEIAVREGGINEEVGGSPGADGKANDPVTAGEAHAARTNRERVPGSPGVRRDPLHLEPHVVCGEAQINGH